MRTEMICESSRLSKLASRLFSGFLANTEVLRYPLFSYFCYLTPEITRIESKITLISRSIEVYERT